MLSPDDTYEVKLAEADDAPRLVYRACSAAHWIDFEKRLRALKNSPSPDYYDRLGAMIAENLVSVPDEWGSRPLLECLDIADVELLPQRIASGAMMSAMDKKKREWPSLFGGNDSAEHARANATNSQAHPSPCGSPVPVATGPAVKSAMTATSS